MLLKSLSSGKQVVSSKQSVVIDGPTDPEYGVVRVGRRKKVALSRKEVM